LRQEAAAGRREDFEKFLASVPDMPPMPRDELQAPAAHSISAQLCAPPLNTSRGTAPTSSLAEEYRRNPN